MNDSFTAREIFDIQNRAILEEGAPTKESRKAKLKSLKKWILENRQEIHKAVKTDLSKSSQETDITEVYPLISELNKATKNIGKWMRPTAYPSSLAYLGTSAKVVCEPKGVCLIISPWNYPFMLAVGPLISAIAAGNKIILKPSELTPSTSALISRMTTELFTSSHVATVEGDVEIAQALLALPFNHIFFTGSPQVGKIVMQAASRYLVSVTLELGGKSPTIVDETANIKDAARKIAWGKWLNAGQTCVAPDYIFVHHTILTEFVDELQSQANLLYGMAKDYSSIVNEKHFRRLQEMKNDALDRGIKLVLNTDDDIENLRMPPQIFIDVPRDALLLKEEVFGPLVAVNEYMDLEEVIGYINEGEKPLALYFFSKSKANMQTVESRTSSGTLVHNDCVLQFAHPSLPFGGVNNSGFGKSHGLHGFKAFSNEKSVLIQRIGTTLSSLLYPPHSHWKNKLIDVLIKYF